MPPPNIPFVPMADPAFVRDPNLASLLRAMRSNINAAYGISGGGGFLAAEKARTTSLTGASAVESGISAGNGVVKMAHCAYDVSSGSGGIGEHYLALVLPVKSVLIRAFCMVMEAFSGDGAAALSIRAGSGVDELTIFADSELATGWAAGYHSSENIGQSAGERARAFKAVVTGGDVKAGKMRLYAEYVRYW